jgi:hypothetical protein
MSKVGALIVLACHSLVFLTAGVADVPHYINFMASFLSNFGEVDKGLTVD